MTRYALCILIVTIFLRPSCGFADDELFWANGNTLVPIHETTIALKKEILKLKHEKEHLFIDVYFEFSNPGKTRTETVGFVTPEGGLDDERSELMPQVTDFAVAVNDFNLKYKVSHFNKTGFAGTTKGRKLADIGDFIFYFSATFKPGLNTIHHSYRIRAGSSEHNSEEYIYRLVTGKSWANKEMEDFTLIIDMGRDAYFSVPQTFWNTGEDIPWKVVGEGMISHSDSSNEWIQNPGMTVRMVKMRAGTVECHMMHFRPDYDLGFGVPDRYDFGHWGRNWMKPGIAQSAAGLPYLFDSTMFELYPDSTMLSKLTEHELVVLKNIPFAIHDCTFKSDELNHYFSQFNWYLPYPERSPDMKLLSRDEAKLVRVAEREEGRREGIQSR